MPDSTATPGSSEPVTPEPVSLKPVSPWNSLEGAKIAAPILSALLLASVGLLISHNIEASKVELADQDRARRLLPKLLRGFGHLSQDAEKDGRRADLRNIAEPYLRVYLADGIVEGWPLGFDYPPNGYEIWLSPSCDMSNGGVRRIAGPGTLVIQSAIRRLEIIDKPSSACAREWDSVPPLAPKKP